MSLHNLNQNKTMNFDKSFFDLPADILSKIYEYDDTFHKIFSSKKFYQDLKRIRHKIHHSQELKKSFIKSAVVSSNIGDIKWEYISRNNFVYFPNRTLGTEFKIFLYPEEDEHTKFKILSVNDDSITIDLDDDTYDGFVCNKKQQAYLVEIFKLEDSFYIHDFRSCVYKNNDILMKLDKMDFKNGLFLHIKVRNDEVRNDELRYFDNYQSYDYQFGCYDINEYPNFHDYYYYVDDDNNHDDDNDDDNDNDYDDNNNVEN